MKLWNFIVPKVAQNWRTWQQPSGVQFWFNRIMHPLCPAINGCTRCRAKQGPTASSSSPSRQCCHRSAGRAKSIVGCHHSGPHGHAPARQKLLRQLASQGSLAGADWQRPRTEREERLRPSPASDRAETPRARPSWAAGTGFFRERSSPSSCSHFWQH